MRFKILSILIVVSMFVLLVSACGPTPEPQVIKETVVVETEKEVTVVETVEVEKEVTVVETVEVEVEVPVEVEVTAVPAEPAEVTYERSETLYTTGTSWGPPSDWNPLTDWSMAMGVEGLLYETLFLYDPLTDEMIPWLAESGEWVDDNTYEIKVREGMNWSDGQPITATDVKLTFDLGQEFAALPYSILWEWLDSIEQVDDYTLLFEFGDPLYHQWSRYLSQISIVPAHIWADRTEEEVTAGANENPVGSGAYLYDTHGQDRMVWVKNPNWWATELLGLEVTPERIVDLVNRSNNVSLGMILQGDLDFSNNFLPGVKTLVEGGYGIETYYPDPPYMLAANTACLWLNLTKPPMDDPAFRSALANSIDVSQIVNVVYGGIVSAANPVGLLPSPAWLQYLDEDLVAQYGFSYDPDKAKQILADAGYADTDGDGFVEAPDGSAFELKVIVPFGWTDWMESINVIARSAQAVGINLVPDFPDYGGYEDQLYGGTFDMAINNFGSGLSNTPWTYFEWVFRSPIAERMTNGNFGRYDNQEAFDLVDQLDKTPLDDKETMQEVMSALQEIMLQDLPTIPLWYNGAWYQGNTTHWSNLPSDREGAPHYYPITWNNYVQYGFLLALTEMQPVVE
jgi:peptide/nickel transport system substrate-binding protein